MIKATTAHGTYYLIDFDNQLAMRVRAEDRNVMSGDSQWFRFSDIEAFDWSAKRRSNSGIEVGKAIYFNLVNHPDYDWRISTDVISIEEYDDSNSSS